MARNDLFDIFRRFFADRGYLEVDTPILSTETIVDAHLDPIVVPCWDGRHRYLQTSPEFGMKRLLAQGSGSIYQIAHAFRAEEFGPLHQPEFLMVEWYRVGATMEEMMDEVAELARRSLSVSDVGRRSYREAFLDVLDICPFQISEESLDAVVRQHGGDPTGANRDDKLNLLLATAIEPVLGRDQPVFLHSYPAGQAALAELDPGPPPTARRFELYWRGIELCNGYQELRDAEEFCRRAEKENHRRKALGKPQLPTGEQFLKALRTGLPPCSGVALGFDRWLMLRHGKKLLREVVPFLLTDF